MKILKFGGTSIDSAKNIELVKNIVSQSTSKIAVIVSAFGGITDLLLEAAKLASLHKGGYKKIFLKIEDKHINIIKKLIPITNQSRVLSTVKSELNTLETLLESAFLIGEITPKLSYKIVSYGELLSSYIISEFFIAEELNAIYKDSRELMQTDFNYDKAYISDISNTNKLILDFFTKNKNAITVLGGFIASSTNENSSTLHHSGADYTASIIAAAVNADSLEIWTDVSGMYTANPKIVKQAKPIKNISYEEAMELSHFGAKVLYPPAIQPVMNKGISIYIKNTFNPESKGTLITKKHKENGKTVRGISHIENISLLSLEGSGMVGMPGMSKRFFEVLSLVKINIVLITQASSEHSICIAISADDVALAEKAINAEFKYEISLKKINSVLVENNLAIIALVGDNMKNHQGLSGKMFSTLGKNNVNIRVIAQGSSERNISSVINKYDVKKALNSLHEEFFEENTKQLNLFIMGVGNVGSRLIHQIKQQRKYLKENLKLNLRIIGISNSRTMFFNEDGISLKNWEVELTNGEKADKEVFFNTIKKLNYRNSIFIDNTASSVISQTYAQYLSNSISVVTCNKIACSSKYKNYKNLKYLAQKYNAPFLFETNVGAGLPIIDTLKHLIASGDKILKIQAMLSGSLNFVFNTFNDTTTFYNVVKQAQEEGYTEPDPKIDLSGVDVARKILILARESGYEIDISEIENNPFLSQESLNTTNNDDFFASLTKDETYFQKLYNDAKKNNCILKYVAQFENGKASVGLQQIPIGHTFYNLEGSDNIVLFYTERYPNRPMIIKGAGAGADVTASGIFADIIRIGNY